MALYDKIEPLATFPGDEVLADKYDWAMRVWYTDWVGILENAMRTVGFAPSPETSETARRIFAVTYYADRLIDHSNQRDIDVNACSQAIGDLRRLEPPEITSEFQACLSLLRNSLDDDADLREELTKRYHGLIQIAVDKMRAQEFDDVRTILLREADLTTELVLSPYAKELITGYGRLLATFKTLMRGGVLLDAAIDRKEDNQAHIYMRTISRIDASILATSGIGYWAVALFRKPCLCLRLLIPDIAMTSRALWNRNSCSLGTGETMQRFAARRRRPTNYSSLDRREK